jgi:hypothetical protein
MNYHLKQLLGRHDPKLLRIRQEISWQVLQSLAQSGDADYVMRYTKQKMAQQLAIQIPLNITETPTKDTLQLDAEIYVFEKSEMLALLAECYTLGSDAAKVMPNFSNF